MSGETNLEIMLGTMSPVLMEGQYVFCSFKDGQYGDHAELEPIASFMEAEGLTLVIPIARAEQHGISYDSAYRCISLGVHSSLDAVGLTAAFSGKLAQHGISANVIAAYYHDHIFVQSEFASAAMHALEAFSSQDDT